MLNTTNSNSEYLHNYIRKVAKQEQESVDTSNVYTGTIEAAQNGIYTIILNQSDKSSSVLAIPIVTGDTYDKGESVYLLKASPTDTVTYFIVGKVNAIQEAFFNLTDLERFNPSESKVVDLVFGANNEIKIEDNENNIFDNISNLGYFQLEMKITSTVEDSDKINIYLNYTNDLVTYKNPRACFTNIDIDQCNVKICHSDSLSPLIISVSGSCEEGSLSIQSESDCHIVFQGLNLQSSMCPTIEVLSKVSTTIELAEYTCNRLADSIVANYNVKYDGCIQTKGNLYLEGKGSLNLKGALKHAIYSKQGTTFRGGDVTIDYASSDAIHAKDYVRIVNGNISIDSIQQDGIDADKGYIDIQGGNINVSVHNKNKKGLKCDSTFNLFARKLLRNRLSRAGSCASAAI